MKNREYLTIFIVNYLVLTVVTLLFKLNPKQMEMTLHKIQVIVSVKIWTRTKRDIPKGTHVEHVTRML